MIKKEQIGYIIKKLRMRQNLTQEKLAEAIDISTQYLSKVERGLCIPSAETFLKMAQILSFSLQDFGVSTFEKNDEIRNELFNIILLASEKENKAFLKILRAMSEIL